MFNNIRLQQLDDNAYWLTIKACSRCHSVVEVQPISNQKIEILFCGSREDPSDAQWEVLLKKIFVGRMQSCMKRIAKRALQCSVRIANTRTLQCSVRIAIFSNCHTGQIQSESTNKVFKCAILFQKDSINFISSVLSSSIVAWSSSWMIVGPALSLSWADPAFFSLRLEVFMHFCLR